MSRTTQAVREEFIKRFMKIAQTVSPRQLYDIDMPKGYLESDNDYIDANKEAAVELLDLAVKYMEGK